MYRTILRAHRLSQQTNNHSILDSLQFDLFEGEVLGILGRAAAGKTTLCNILSGECYDYTGQIYYYENPVEIRSLYDAKALGIYCIDQNLGLIPTLSITQNLLSVQPTARKLRAVRRKMQKNFQKPIFLDREKTDFSAGFLSNRKNTEKFVNELLAEWNLPISAKQSVESLSRMEQYLLEIVKAVLSGAKIIILHEITNYYSERNDETLSQYIEQLVKRKISVIFINSKLLPMTSFCDRITVLKNGKNVGNFFKEEFSKNRFEILLADKGFEKEFAKQEVSHSQYQLRALLPPAPNGKREISIKACKGEIVGIVEPQGNTSDYIAEAISGMKANAQLQLYLNGNKVKINHSKQAQKHGIGILYSLSDGNNLFPNLSVGLNLNLLVLKKMRSSWKYVKGSLVRYSFSKCAAAFGRENISETEDVNRLNIEERLWLYMGRWSLINPKVLLMIRSGETLDFISRKYVYSLMDAMAKKGTTILFFTTRASNAQDICDRIYLMENNDLCHEYNRQEIDNGLFMQHMLT